MNQTVTDKIRYYHPDYNNRPSNTSTVSLCSVIFVDSSGNRKSDFLFRQEFTVDLGTPGGGWTKIVLRGDLRVFSGVQGGFRHSGGVLDLS